MRILTAALTGAVATLALVGSPLAPRLAGPLGSAAALAQDYDAGYDVSPFYDQLQPYGYWAFHPRHGQVWVPAEVEDTWRPYEDGRWVYTDQWGWYFDASTAWGDIVHHYGRWAYEENWGWIWIPGEEWGPGWVSWRYGAGVVGWAPLGADQAAYDEDEAYWSFAPAADLGRPNVLLSDVVIRRPARVREIWIVTRPAGRPVAGRPRNVFLDLRRIERDARVVIRPRPVTVRVAFGPGGRPIGFRDRADIRFRYEPVRARPGAPSPLVTARIVEGVRTGRLKTDDPAVRLQVVRAARAGHIAPQAGNGREAIDRLNPGRRDRRDEDDLITSIREGRAASTAEPAERRDRTPPGRPVRGEDAAPNRGGPDALPRGRGQGGPDDGQAGSPRPRPGEAGAPRGPMVDGQDAGGPTRNRPDGQAAPRGPVVDGQDAGSPTRNRPDGRNAPRGPVVDGQDAGDDAAPRNRPGAPRGSSVDGGAPADAARGPRPAGQQRPGTEGGQQRPAAGRDQQPDGEGAEPQRRPAGQLPRQQDSRPRPAEQQRVVPERVDPPRADPQRAEPRRFEPEGAARRPAPRTDPGDAGPQRAEPRRFDTPRPPGIADPSNNRRIDPTGGAGTSGSRPACPAGDLSCR